MVWVDAVLLNVMPAFVVMSVLAVLAPSLRRSGSWRGIGVAWLATLGVGLLVAVTHPNDWSLNCPGLLLRTGATGVATMNPTGPCTGWNGLPPWLGALPPLLGIAILLGSVWRQTRPLSATLRTIAALAAVTVAIVGLGRVNQNAALFAVVTVAAADYIWPRLRGRPAF
jgi:hypothetical protein